MNLNVTRVSDYGYVLEAGRIVREGPGNVLANDDAVIGAYLGHAAA